MRKTRQIILTLILTFLLLGAAWIAGVSGRQTKLDDVVAAAGEIAAGSQITADMLKIIKIPEDARAECYLSDPEAAIGRWTTVPVSSGELMNSHLLYDSAAGIAYPEQGKGRRLLTLDLPAADANGYWLAAGNRVDLYLIPNSYENGEVMQILENIRIMSILSTDTGLPLGLSEASSAGDARLICLDLENEQARLIMRSIGLCEIRLAAINEPGVEAKAE